MMASSTGGAVALSVLMGLLRVGGGEAQSQVEQAPRSAQTARITTLALPPATTERLQRLLDQHEYIEAEKLLLPLVNSAPADATTAARLAYLGGVYYLAQDYLSAAIALKKSGAIVPLAPSLRFTLAMSYIRIRHSDWATAELRDLAAANPHEALYPYWLGRLAYDAQRYEAAIQYFDAAIAIDSKMARAYDNLGLCHFYLNHNDRAIELFERAIALDRGAKHPSPWPYLNLGIAQALLGRSDAAETSFRQALELDPKMAQAHFQLGSLLMNSGRLTPAGEELQAASAADPAYPEPHYALARLYRRQSQNEKAEEEVRLYQRLRDAAAGKPMPED